MNGEFEITKREVIVSISIIAILLCIGFLISSKISDSILDHNEQYNDALKIESAELFQYGMRTDAGKAFIYGELKAVDPVTYPEIKTPYLYIKKVKERYTRHSRVVTYTTGSGKHRTTHTRIEHYWTWDRIDSDEKKSEKVSFCETEFPAKKIVLPEERYLKTIKESSRIRYRYYVVKDHYKGTLFTDLKKNTISNHSAFYQDQKIKEVVKDLKDDNTSLVIFWFVWIILIFFLVGLFCYMKNAWLE